ncbi:ATP-dependent helicase/deoxyribonuclease subunit B [bioreactor metagenome]|uniref:ATP-dependent helicase/deoxyribonuclease subunit B n=1 Tax=bioreactor metagenome TaxID=1076179 RepID=A0A644W7W3_9ZZZZ
MSFIEELASTIIETSGTDLRSVAVVLPGRRGGLFLKKALAKAAGKAILLPQIQSIEEYIFMQSGMRKMDETTSLSLLYSVYKSHAGADAFPLDDFLPTGKTLLSDFNDVDDYLLDPEEVFTYLSRVREIENWIPGEAETDLQKKYLSFYRLLNPVYKLFLEKCTGLGMGYQGLASRVLAQKDDVSDFSKVFFAGLNAITPSLEAHINKLILKGKAQLVWDSDNWYLNNPVHEAGHFMRLNRSNWPDTFDEIPHHFEESRKKIDLIGAPLGYSQVQTALTLLDGKYKEAFSDTVLVLADEGLLLPLLSSLPADWADRVNISGGYPLRNTFLGQLIIARLNLVSGESGNAQTYRFEALQSLVSNPLLRLLPEEKHMDGFLTVLNEISSGKIRYFHWSADSEKPDSVILRKFNDIIPGLVSPADSWAETLLSLEKLTEDLFERSGEADLEHEAAWMVHTMLKALHNTLTLFADTSDLTLQSLVFYIRRQLQVAKIPLRGEPLQGIQILGMLETRSLDFKNVVVIGANEGFLPAGGHSDSFLPADVRRELGLPLQYERDAVYSYHFWRLIQRASEITLIYNTESDPVFGKEPSRFLSQIEHELMPAFPDFVLTKKILGIEYSNLRALSAETLDRETIEKVLDEIAEKGLSFSSFYDFVICPFRFLLAHICKIREWEEESGDIASNTMGSVFHETMELLTRPFIGKTLSKNDFDTMAAAAEATLDSMFEKQKVVHTASGYNFLVREILRDALTGWLTKMRDSVPVDYSVLAAEKDITSEITLNSGRKVKLRGIADRIELYNGITRIMDFKTTHRRSDFIFDVSPEADIELLVSDSKNRYFVQVLFYAWLFSVSENKTGITGGVYPVLNNQGYRPDLIMNKDKEAIVLSGDHLKSFGAVISDIVGQIFSSQQNFSAKPSVNACQYCPYKNVICFAAELVSSEDE